MVTVTRRIGKILVQEEFSASANVRAPSGRDKTARSRKSTTGNGGVVSNETVLGILSILNNAALDGNRFKDVLDGFMKSQNAPTMIEVARRFSGGAKPKTKVEAHRRLVDAYNRKATTELVKKKAS